MNTVTVQGECFACKSKLCRFATARPTGNGRRTIELARGERVETCANACLKFWTIVSGTAAICTSLPDGRRQISGIERAGSTICGPMANEDSPSWLEALEPTRVCELDFSSDIHGLQDDPGFLFAMFGVVHKRLEQTSRHLMTLGRLDSTERVILFLAETARGWRRSGPVTLPMSREDIADYLGLNAETVSRIFSRLRKSGLFHFLSPTEFEVPDFAAIERRLPIALGAPPVDPMATAVAGEPSPVMETRT